MEPALTESTMRRLMEEFTEKNRLQLTEVAGELRHHVDKVTGELRSDFGGLRTEFEGLRTEFGGLRTEFGGLRTEFEGLRTEFGGLRTEFEGLRTEFADLRQHVDEVTGEIRRHFDVVTEDLRGDIRLIAEGHAVLQTGLENLRSDMSSEFKEVRSLLKVSHTDLDRRLRVGEETDRQHESRLTRLERSSPKAM